MTAELRRRCGFLHIPKTAGTSVLAALTAAYAPTEIAPYQFDHVIFGGFTQFDTFAESIRRRTLTLDDTPVMLDARLVAGHLAYQTIVRFMDPHDVFTVVREPRARIISQQLFWSTRTPAIVAPYGAYQIERTAVDGLKRYLSGDAAAHQYDNIHVRMLCGEDLPMHRPLTELERTDAASLAVENLRTLGAVTAVEIPTFWQDVSSFVGFNSPEPRLNDTAARTEPVGFRGPQFDAEVLELLQRSSAGDRVVYCAALSRRLGVDAVAATSAADRAFAAQIERYVRIVARSEFTAASSQRR